MPSAQLSLIINDLSILLLLRPKTQESSLPPFFRAKYILNLTTSDKLYCHLPKSYLDLLQQPQISFSVSIPAQSFSPPDSLRSILHTTARIALLAHNSDHVVLRSSPVASSHLSLGCVRSGSALPLQLLTIHVLHLFIFEVIMIVPTFAFVSPLPGTHLSRSLQIQFLSSSLSLHKVKFLERFF